MWLLSSGAMTTRIRVYCFGRRVNAVGAISQGAESAPGGAVATVSCRARAAPSGRVAEIIQAGAAQGEEGDVRLGSP
jgi:hypothetical protein